MAKRAAPDEQPYRPLLDASLVSAALSQVTSPAEPSALAPAQKVIDLPRAETPKRAEPPRAPVVLTERVEERAVPSQLFEKFDQEKRILFTRSESYAVERLVASLASRLNTQVKVSHVVRALVTLLLNAEGEIDKRAGEGGPLVRPPNGDAQALQRFEREIAKIIGAGLRDAGPVR